MLCMYNNHINIVLYFCFKNFVDWRSSNKLYCYKEVFKYIS